MLQLMRKFRYRTTHLALCHERSFTISSSLCKKRKAGPIHIASANYDIVTIPGDKKDVSIPLPKAYSPRFTEAAWYDWWVARGYFKPSTSGERFIMLLPPPNVTGKLHIGHAFTSAIQDAIVRWNRMRGRSTLWIPGVDHAGIATQVVVEKQLKRDEGLYRHEIGRDEFLKRTWTWKANRTEDIRNQLKCVGLSLDWSREFFTMDQKSSEAVTAAFVRLFDQGLITRSFRMVNWSCALKSAIADIEVDNMAINGPTRITLPDKRTVVLGYLTSFVYKIPETDGEIEVATTRLETMLGDMAIAVHPSDPRYKHLIGKRAVHPFTNRSLPIIADEIVEPQLGTGVVKLTPSHSSIDHDVAVRHHLQHVNILTDDGKITNSGAQFEGMDRFDARERVAQLLQKAGLWRGQTEHQLTVPICSRSGDIVEPRLKEQWFLDVSDMARAAIKASEDGELKFIPPYYSKTWKNTLNLTIETPWCISRQLWWGHQIPAYKVIPYDKEVSPFWVAGNNVTEAISRAKQQLDEGVEFSLKQDADVLDTWFSSALLPFSVLGWPTSTPDLKTFYPGSMIESGSDILFFWIARMVMFGQYFLGKLPFKQVVIHSLLLAQGEKMSKSKGNVIDPMSIINGSTIADLEKSLAESHIDRKEMTWILRQRRKQFGEGIPECGADALRMALCSYPFKGDAINIDVKAFIDYRSLGNKIWQTFRFFGQYTEDFSQTPLRELNDLTLLDRWILHKAAQLVEVCNSNFEPADLDVICHRLKNFWQRDFANTYLECTKDDLRSDDSLRRTAVLNVAVSCMDSALRCLAPFMPFLSEELYQRLPADNKAESVCIADFPVMEQWAPYKNDKLGEDMTQILTISSAISEFKSIFGLGFQSKRVGDVYMNGLSHSLIDLAPLIQSKARLEALHVEKRAPLTASANQLPTVSTCAVHIDLHNHLKKNGELDKMTMKITELLNAQSSMLKAINKVDKNNLSEIELCKHLTTIHNMKTQLELTENCAEYIMSLI